MKIISDFKDYYDYITFAGSGFKDDYRDNVYKRMKGSFVLNTADEQEAASSWWKYGSKMPPAYYHCDFFLSSAHSDDGICSKWWKKKREEFLLGDCPDKIGSSSLYICGKIYPFIYIEGKSCLQLDSPIIKETVLSKHRPVTISRWSSIERKYVEQPEVRYIKTFFDPEEFLDDIDVKGNRSSKYDVERLKKSARGFFEGVVHKDCSQLHIRADAPILLGSPYRVGHRGKNFVTNPCLYTYGFERIMSAEILCQELDVFFSNFLVKDIMPSSFQSDIDKLTSHGFDIKTSFRKQKDKDSGQGKK